MFSYVSHMFYSIFYYLPTANDNKNKIIIPTTTEQSPIDYLKKPNAYKNINTSQYTFK